MAWEYKREEQSYPEIPEGDYRIRVFKAETSMSKKGNDMISLQFQVSGRNGLLFHYITFLNDRPEITNRMLTNFFDGFPGIPEGNCNLAMWVGQVGACHVKHDDDGRAKISYFIRGNKQDNLPPWKEPEGAKAVKAQAQVDSEFRSIPDELEEDLPFD